MSESELLRRIYGMKAALLKIATEHISYSQFSSTPYHIGVVDGHRCAACIARKALDDFTGETVPTDSQSEPQNAES